MRNVIVALRCGPSSHHSATLSIIRTVKQAIEVNLFAAQNKCDDYPQFPNIKRPNYNDGDLLFTYPTIKSFGQ